MTEEVTHEMYKFVEELANASVVGECGEDWRDSAVPPDCLSYR